MCEVSLRDVWFAWKVGPLRLRGCGHAAGYPDELGWRLTIGGGDPPLLEIYLWRVTLYVEVVK